MASSDERRERFDATVYIRADAVPGLLGRMTLMQDVVGDIHAGQQARK